MNKSIWGKVKTQLGGWALSSKTTTKLIDPLDNVSFNVDADNGDADVYLEFAKSGSSKTLQIAKGFGALGGRLSVNPRYTIGSNADVVLGFDTDKTSVTIEAAKDGQKLSVAHQVTEDHKLTPTITTKGDYSLAWEKSLEGGNSLTTTLEGSDAVSVEWNDGPWTAVINAPLTDYKPHDVTVRVNRKLSFL